MNPSEYYKILEVDENVSLEQLNKAYRTKAKSLHPDINPSANAHQQFIFLHEAYEYAKRNLTTNKAKFNAENSWQNARKQANEQAEKQAKMRYNEYLNSDEYRYLFSINILLDHVEFLLSVCLPFLIPILFYKWADWEGVVTGIILLLFISPYLVKCFKKRKSINWPQFIAAFNFLKQFEEFKLLILCSFNFYCFWNYALVTMIDMKIIVGLYCLSVIFCYLLWHFKFKNLTKITITFLLIGIAPLITNFLFITNYYTGFNATTEVYNFYVNNKKSSIVLQNEAYQEFTFIRFYVDTDHLNKFHSIKYTFATGCYGWRVMKNDELIK
jgi:hypothetical protein